MNINELFEKLQEENFNEEIKGEINIEGNCLVWSYDLNKDSEEIEVPEIQDDEDFMFESTSPAELLQEAYSEDIAMIEEKLAELDEFTEWTFSDPEVGDTTISFKIF